MIGLGIAAYDGEGKMRSDDIHAALDPAFALCIEALAQDPPITPSGPWSAP